MLTTPETVSGTEANEALREARPALMCIDEVHCVSAWGHDFRPAYLRLGVVRDELGAPQMLGLTATATAEVRADIAERLGMQRPVEVIAPPVRDNLALEAISAPGNLKFEAAGELLQRLKRPGIVYCSTTKAVDQIYTTLRKAQIPCARYHGKMKKADRDAAQRRFARKGKGIVMVATNAFGMGIDKADIRYVIHHQVPGSIEQYVQEAGRAGRDGKRSRCILLFDEEDLRIQEHLQAKSRASAAQLRRVVRALEAWVREDKDFNPKEIALGARVPATVARSACVELEDLGVLVRGPNRRLRGATAFEELDQAAEDLARQLETLRRQDARRLRAMADYAQTEGCRSVFIRRWFGEDDPPVCGRCDRCQQAQSAAKKRR